MNIAVVLAVGARVGILKNVVAGDIEQARTILASRTKPRVLQVLQVLPLCTTHAFLFVIIINKSLSTTRFAYA